MGIRSPLNLRPLIWLVVLSLALTGCITETNNRMAQNKNPQKALEAYVDAGMLYMQRNQMDDAHRTLSRAYEIDKNDPSVNNAMALFFSIEGDKPQTEKHFKQALTVDPDFSQARNNYAAFLFQEGRYKDAIQQLERVVKDYRYDRRSTAYENLGQCYLKVNEFEQAEEAFNRALRLNPNLSVSLLELAHLYYEKGNNLAASQYLASYEKISRPSPRQLWLGIRLQRVLGDKNKLASYELALRNMFPGSAEYQAYLASKSS